MTGLGKLRWRPNRLIPRVLRGGMAVWFAALSFGIPLPAPPVAAVSSEAYPCMDHRCGCRDAEHCWRSCCCMTREQKFAWAVEHGVRPPPSFFAGGTPGPVEVKPQSCCARREHIASCCEKKVASCCQKSKPRTRRTSGETSLIDALGCNGQQVLTAMAIPPSLRPRRKHWPRYATPRARR